MTQYQANSERSTGGPFVTGSDYIIIAMIPDFDGVLIIENTGAVNVEISKNRFRSGKQIAPGDVLTLDGFQGHMYARSPLGAGSVDVGLFALQG